MCELCATDRVARCLPAVSPVPTLVRTAGDDVRVHFGSDRATGEIEDADQPDLNLSRRRPSIDSTMLPRCTPTSSAAYRFVVVSGGESTLRRAKGRTMTPRFWPLAAMRLSTAASAGRSSLVSRLAKFFTHVMKRSLRTLPTTGRSW